MLPRDAKNVLQVLVGRLGQVVPDDMRTYPGYGEVHAALGLQQAGETIGQSLQNQGLESLGRWAMGSGLPAIDGIVVDRNSLLPGHGFYQLHERQPEDFRWLIDQVAEAKAYDWTTYIEEQEPETLSVRRAMVLVDWLGARAAANGGIIRPFTSQEAMGVLGWDDPQRYGQAHGNVQSLIDFACYRCDLPPLGLTSSTPFKKAWSTGNRAWTYPVSRMKAAARAKQWSEADFQRVRAMLQDLPGSAHQLWKAAVAQEETLLGWAQSFGDIEISLEKEDVREFERGLQELLGKPGRRGGIAPGLTAGQRKAIETRAMVVAREALEGDGWQVDDMSLGHPFDLLACRSGTEMHVEVKGTTTSGERVVLTRGEVKHQREIHAISALYIVSGIELAGSPDAPEASGGLLRSWVPWSIEDADLTPLAYEYSVPSPERQP